jgi:dTDP-4-dehydrorhamnose reductase
MNRITNSGRMVNNFLWALCYMTQNALIIGADSTIGRTLTKKLREIGWNVFGTTRRQGQAQLDNFFVDLEHENTIENINRNFDVIYACAAITNIDFCEKNPGLSKQVNLDAQISLAKHCINKTKSYIFLSTAGVFDGSVPMNSPNSTPNPKCNYGIHKALTERFLIGFSEKITIVRTTKVITKDNKLINNWIETLNNNSPIDPFHDMTLAPVPIDLLISLLQQIFEDRTKPIVHISGKNDIPYSKLAHLLASRLGISESLIKPKSYLQAGLAPNTVFPYSSLDMFETTQHYGLQPPSIEDILDIILKNAR